MPHYNEVFVSPSDFEFMISLGMPYDGFIEGVGYAYTTTDAIPPRHFQKNNPPGYLPYNESFYQMFFVQHIDDSPSMRLMSENRTKKLPIIKEDGIAPEAKNQGDIGEAINQAPVNQVRYRPIFSCKPHGPMIIFGHEVWPSEARDPLIGNRDAANTGYTNWNWESDDVQVPLKVLSILTTGGAAIEAQGVVRILSFLSIGNNVIGLTGLDAKIPGYNNPYFMAARDAVFVATSLTNPYGAFETPSTFIDGINTFHSIEELMMEKQTK